jgi:hypothetical protein
MAEQICGLLKEGQLLQQLLMPELRQTDLVLLLLLPLLELLL